MLIYINQEKNQTNHILSLPTQIFDQALKVEYPICVSIKITLTGKLAIDGQNLIYFENVQKPLKKLIPGNVQISSFFL